MYATRYLSSLALRSPVKSHSAARAAGTAIALCPSLRSICLSVICVGSVERSRRETPRRAPRRRASRTPFDPEGARAGERPERAGDRARGFSWPVRLLTGNIDGRAERNQGRSSICPALSSDRRSTWRPATTRAGAVAALLRRRECRCHDSTILTRLNECDDAKIVATPVLRELHVGGRWRRSDHAG